MNFEYYLFSKDDPISHLKDYAKDLSLAQKRKVSSYIKRAEALTKKVQKFRDFLLDEELLNDIISSTFLLYFDNHINKTKYICIPRDASVDFKNFFRSMIAPGLDIGDKYVKKAEYLIALHAESIDPFIKAFLSIRIAQSEIAKLKSS